MYGNNVQNLLLYHFDQINVLSLVNRRDRQHLIERQFEFFNIPIPDNTEVPVIRYYFGVEFPFNDIIADALTKSKKGKFTKPNEYDCARNHYNMIKIAYERGLNFILIIEDDVLFYKNSDYFVKVLESIPGDYDVLQFGGFTTDERILKYIENTDSVWVKHNNIGVWNCSMYALSRRGMEYYIKFMESVLFWVADGPLYTAPMNHKMINSYILAKPLVIQADKNVISSDIRNEENDSIDYQKDNVYERNIDRDKYYSTNI